MTLITTVIAAHNPHAGRLRRTMDGIARQTLPSESWCCLLIDNGSSSAISTDGFPIGVRVVHEPKLGLTWARLRGILEATSPFIAFVDDDNVLSPDYLQNAAAILGADPTLGAIGGKCLPIWESDAQPPAWTKEFEGSLALRNLGDDAILASWRPGGGYPAAAPVGAGMVVRRDALRTWIDSLRSGNTISDRRGTSLTSGGDNDIVMHIARAGYKVGYFPQLVVSHIIPQIRLSPEYMARLNRGIARSWVEVLAAHGIRPWPPASPWTLPARKARAYFRHRAWAGPAEYIRWQAACGTFEGRAALPSAGRRV